MPLSNLYITNYNAPGSIIPGSTTGNFGTWGDAGFTLSENYQFGFPTDGSPNLFEDGVAGVHTGGLPRSYAIRLTPQVPDGVTYLQNGNMSFCTLDLSISGHYGSIKSPYPSGGAPSDGGTPIWSQYWDTLEIYSNFLPTTVTHEYNPLWQTEYDPYHGTTPIQDAFETINGPWNYNDTMYGQLNVANGFFGYGFKYWNEETVKQYGDQSLTNPYSSVASTAWPCDENDTEYNNGCDPESDPNIYMHGKGVPNGQDAASLWDSRVSHIVAFDTLPWAFLGMTGSIPVRSSPYNTDLSESSGFGYQLNRMYPQIGNEVIVIVVLKPAVTWNEGNLNALSDVINIDFDGNAYFLNDQHRVVNPGDPPEDTGVDINNDILGEVNPGTGTPTTEDPDPEDPDPEDEGVTVTFTGTTTGTTDPDGGAGSDDDQIGTAGGGAGVPGGFGYD